MTRRARPGAALAVLLAASLCTACIPWRGGWDVGALEAREPALRARRMGPHRLGDASPYFAPTGGPELVLFLCRWETPRPLAVAFAPDATPVERRLAWRALDAWSGADLGLRFVETPDPARADIALRFTPADEDAGEESLAGEVSADCALPPGGRAEPARDRLDARLAFASVVVRRSQPDALGRPVPLSEAELLGTLMHELGHALGFQGHARTGPGAMVRSTDEVRAIGRHLLEGEPWTDPTLQALYALPSGAVVGRVALAADPSPRIALVARLAAAAGLEGPFARVGDRGAMLVWRAAPGSGGAHQAGLLASPWPELLAEPARLALVPDAGALRLLATLSRPSGPAPAPSR